MEKSELLETSDYYKENEARWRFLEAANDGFRSLYEYGILSNFQNPEQYIESGRAYSFNYTKRINSILTGFIADTYFQSDYKPLKDDKMFQAFILDCDLMGTDFEIFWNCRRLIGGLFGLCGLLVDRGEGGNPQFLIDNNIYPYLTSYSPLDILDFDFSRDEASNRPYLSYIKLRQYNPDTVQIWTPENFEVHDISGEEATLIKEGENPLKEIPFVFYYNTKKPGSNYEGIGNVDDIVDIDVSLVIDSVMAGSILRKTAFPMYITPKLPGEFETKEVSIGKDRIQEYDPETPNAKPFWLAPEASAAINPLMLFMEKKISEIYDMANLSGIRVASQSRQSRSADSYEQMFRFLKGRLSSAVDNEIEARKNVIRYWLKWQDKSDLYQDVQISHDHNFEIEKLITTIDDVMTEKSLLSVSDTAQRELLKTVMRTGSLADISEKKQAIISEEIDNAVLNPVLPDVGIEEESQAEE